MAAVNPVILLAKFPVPEPSAVLESRIVGPVEILQQTPRAITADPPSTAIFPPLMAEVVVIEVIVVVVMVGWDAIRVVKLISFP